MTQPRGKQKKRRRKAAPLDRYKNYVRGNTNKLEALSEIRRELPTHFLPAFASWSIRALKYDVFRSLEPTRLTDIQIPRIATAGTLEEELAWCETLLELRNHDLRGFLSRKQRLEKTLLETDGLGCLSILDEIEHEHGPSLWLLSVKIGLLQILQGMEAQKEYVTEVKNARQALTRFLAHWWGIRIEQDTTIDRYSNRVQRQLERASLGVEYTTYYGYLLLGLAPPSGSEQVLLAAATSSTAVDLYQIYTDLLVVSVAEERPSAQIFIRSALKLGLHEIDPRVSKVSLLLGHAQATAACANADLTMRNEQFGDLAKALKIEGNAQPTGLEEISAAASIRRPTSPLSNQFTSTVFELVSQINDRSPAGVRSSAELLKLGIALDKLSTGAWCMAAALEAQETSSVAPNDFAKLRLINTPDLEPFLLNHLPGPTRAVFAATLQDRYHNQPTIGAALAASQAIADEEATRLGVSKKFLLILNLTRAFHARDFEKALEIARGINLHFSEATKLTIQVHIFSLIELQRLHEALVACAEWYLQDRTIAAWLPLDEMNIAIRASRSALDNMIEKPILYDALARIKGGDFHSLKAYATEDFVLSYGVDRPSQLDTSVLRASKEELVFFYNEICTAQVLRLSVAYQTERELDEELIAICNTLIRIDPENLEIYEERARELVRARSIKDALKELQRSKVSIDEDALKAKLKENFQEDYDRYITFIKSGVAVVDESYRKDLLKAAASGEISASLFDVPDNEASALFAGLVLNIIGELTYNPEHGLDCYLSLRIRHGTLSGQLRGPVEREHIVTRRDASTREYQPNKYWGERLHDHVFPDDHRLILRLLAEFSREYDNLIFSLTDQRIQVFRKEKPDGLFRLTIPELTIYGLATDVKPETSFDQFLNLCIDSFWSLVEASLANIRQYIDHQLRSSIRDQFDKLDAALQKIAAPQIAPLSDAIRRARTDTGVRLDAMRHWFVQPTPNSSVPFTLQELVDIALTTIKGFRPEFNPRVNIVADDIPSLIGALRLFSDIFFILFENISSYSGNPVTPHIKIQADLSDPKMTVRVTNEIEPDIDLEHIDQQVRLARQRIDSGAFLNAVRSEGGTGLPKLAKLIKGTQDHPPLKFGIASQRTFFVEFELNVVALSLELEETS